MPSPKTPKIIRDQVTARASRRCEYCFSPLDYSPDPFTIEHIIPRSQNGSDSLDNLALACFGCNNAKYNRTVGVDAMTGEAATLYNPRVDQWSAHFEWNDAQVHPLSATGRVTVVMLKLNRSALINLRQLLSLIGMHPPADIDDR